MVETPQLSYYYKHRVERSLYAKAYYRAKKLQTGAEKKVRKRYRTWKANNDKIQEYKNYLQENQITSIIISFFS